MILQSYLKHYNASKRQLTAYLKNTIYEAYRYINVNDFSAVIALLLRLGADARTKLGDGWGGWYAPAVVEGRNRTLDDLPLLHCVILPGEHKAMTQSLAIMDLLIDYGVDVSATRSYNEDMLQAIHIVARDMKVDVMSLWKLCWTHEVTSQSRKLMDGLTTVCDAERSYNSPADRKLGDTA